MSPASSHFIGARVRRVMPRRQTINRVVCVVSHRAQPQSDAVECSQRLTHHAQSNSCSRYAGRYAVDRLSVGLFSRSAHRSASRPRCGRALRAPVLAGHNPCSNESSRPVLAGAAGHLVSESAQAERTRAAQSSVIPLGYFRLPRSAATTRGDSASCKRTSDFSTTSRRRRFGALAKRAKSLIVDTWHAAHQATGAIEAVRPRNSRFSRDSAA